MKGLFLSWTHDGEMGSDGGGLRDRYLDKLMTAFQGGTPEDYLAQRRQESWIRGFSQEALLQRVEDRLEILSHCQGGRVLIFLSTPMEVLAAFMACAIARCPIFLGNPHWKQGEREQAIAIAQPHLIWRDHGNQSLDTGAVNIQEAGWMMIPTGGTSGQIKFAIHTWETISAAVAGMQEFFFPENPLPIDSCCVLPLYHVSGLMQWMRSLLTGGTFTLIPFKDFLQGSSNHEPTNAFLQPTSNAHHNHFLSLVPTQLSRILAREQPEQLHWLAQFRCILLGGAPASEKLLTLARKHQLRIAPTYGMTETGAQVITLRPEDFLQGKQPPGDVLPHVSLQMMAAANGVGQMQWSGPSICLGYYPHLRSSQSFLTDDLAEERGDGSLRILGRASRKILCGGENIYPEEVESILTAMIEIEDAYVFGVPDDDWGEVAIAAYVTRNDAVTSEILSARIKLTIASYKCPKIWWRRSSIPRNPQGKVEIKQLQETWRFETTQNHTDRGDL